MRKILLSMVLAILMMGSTRAQVQNALSFDNIDDYVDVPNASALITGSNTLSLTCWVYPSNTNITWPDYDGFCGFRNNTDADFYLIQHAPTSVEARFRNSAGTASDVVITDLLINTWQHFAFTYDGSFVRLYHNGALAGSAPASGTIANNLVTFYIGNLLYSSEQFYMNGKIDEVSLWHKALNLDEIQHIYNCAVDPAASGLLLYYKFDQGIANGNNTSITNLIPTTGSLNGILHNFALTGTTSNFVPGVGTPVYTVSETICHGESYQFGSQILTAPGVYTETFTGSGGCDSVVQLTLIVYTPNTAVTLSGVTLTAQQAGAAYKWVNCNTGFSVITGATSQSYTATANGSYAVIVTINNCTDTSNCVAVTTVGVPDNIAIPGLIIYPNPVEDYLFIDLAQCYEHATLRIYNVSGQEVVSDNYKNTQLIKKDVADLPRGMYFLNLTVNQYQTFLKIIK